LGELEIRPFHMSFSQEEKDSIIEEETGEKAKRLAIVVGVNKYQEYSQIPILAGAENDAEELRRRLTTNNNFQILDGHFLVGEDATRSSILKAISDVFRNEVDAELVIFYFSGHGILDENQEGYIAPYDMYPKDPFVSGIKMEDLKYVIERSNNKANVAIILDCCYAGIVTKGTKALPDENKKNLYVTQLQKLGQTPVNDDETKPRRAKFILASSEGNAESREKNDCVHTDISRPPHAHGAFSFHLLEGLGGAAARPDTGIITFDSLRKYVEEKMMAEKKQKPMYTIAEASLIESITLGYRQEDFNRNVEKLIADTRKLITKPEQAPIFIDIRDLSDAVNKVRNLSVVDPKNSNIQDLITNIDDALKPYQQSLDDWLNKNIMIAGREIDKIAHNLYNRRFYDICDNLSYDGFQKLNDLDLEYLLHLIPEIEDKTAYASKDEKRLQRLCFRLNSATKARQL
jgi:hypothetical protein